MLVLSFLLFAVIAPAAAQIGRTDTFLGGDIVEEWRCEEGFASCTFTVTAKTTGWIAIGFSSDVKMAETDVVVVWVDDLGEGHAVDGWIGAGHKAPVADEDQFNVELVDFSEVDGVTRVSFSRIFTVVNTESSLGVFDTRFTMHAYGASDPPDDDISRMGKHENVVVIDLDTWAAAGDQGSAQAVDDEVNDAGAQDEKPSGADVVADDAAAYSGYTRIAIVAIALGVVAFAVIAFRRWRRGPSGAVRLADGDDI